MNIDDLIATAQPRTEQVPICARGDLVAKWIEAVERLGATADDDALNSPAVQATIAEAEEIEQAMEDATMVFTVCSTSRETWADLLATYPPTKEQRRAGHDHDPQTFPVAAVAASVKDPELSHDKAKQLAAVLHPGEWAKLWEATYRLNVTEMPHPKLAAATDLLRASGQSSTTSGREASLEAGSLAGSGAQ